MSHCCIGRWYMIEAFSFMYCVVKSPPHDKPHNHLYPFGARLSYIFGMGKIGKRSRFIDKAVQKKLVEITVDEPCTFAF